MQRLLFLLVVFFMSVSFAQKKEASYTMYSFEDVNATQTIHSITKEHFTPQPERRVNYGLTNSTIWLKFNLHKQQLSPEAVLYIKNAFCDELTLYYYDEKNTIVEESQGILVPNSKNKLNHYLPSFLIPTKKLSSSTIYLKIKGRWPLQIDTVIQQKEDFYNKRVIDYLIAGLFMGGFILLGIYNLFLFFSTRDTSYILYVLALFSTTLTQGYLYGFLTPYIFPSSQKVLFSFLVFSSAITSIFSVWFTIKFLDIKNVSTFFYRLLIISFLFPLTNISLEFLGYYVLSRQVYLISVVFIACIILISGFYAYRKRKKIALFFTIAWSFYLLGVIIYVLKFPEILPYNTFTAYSIPIGTLLESTLISFALGYRYNLIQKEKEHLEKQTKEELEKLVTLQTNKLATSLQEKNILLQEIHHRVKNNLQLVISLLDLRVASVKDSENKKILDESKARIHSMSLIHQRLYQSDNLEYVDMKSYLEELFTYIRDSYMNSNLNFEYLLSIDQVNLPLSKAVPLGLIVNELLTNSFKYGISNNTKTNIINLSSKINNNALELFIADSGKGFKENVNDLNVKKSLGLFLVESLTLQLKGKIKRYFEKELFVTKLSIPIPKL